MPHGHAPRKRFGQHFLHDPQVIAHIARAFGPRPGQTIVEIGPGLGALTDALLRTLPALHVVELDRDLAPRLRETYGDRLTVHQADAVSFDFCRLVPGGVVRVIGNLPYNISTPLLFHLLTQTCVADMVFMLQKEVVDRMAAPPGGKDYGRLSVMIQARCVVEPLFNVGPGAFTPPPKVDSAVVRLTPHAAPPVVIDDERTFARVVQAAFAQRRKTLRNTLKGIVTPEAMATAGIDPGRRAETLSLAEFAAISNRVVQD